jgi:hypothetical protein
MEHRPQLPAIDVPLFEAMARLDTQPSNIALWQAYMVLRQSGIDGRDGVEERARLKRECARQIG